MKNSLTILLAFFPWLVLHSSRGQADDGTEDHLPSGTTLASYTLYDPMDKTFPYVPLSADLVEGDLYHIVFSNVAPGIP